MLNIRYRPQSEQTPDDRDARAVLDGIIADLRTLLPLSRTQVRFFAQLKKANHAARRAKLIDSAAALREELDQNYARLRALSGDPLPLDDDQGEDMFDMISAAVTPSHNQKKGTA